MLNNQNNSSLLNEQSMISFANGNNKSELRNISSMQDIKQSIKKESLNNLISPFQVNSSNNQMSFNQLNRTMDSSNANIYNTINRPLTGQSRHSNHSHNKKGTDNINTTFTRPGTGYTIKTKTSKMSRSNANTSHD